MISKIDSKSTNANPLDVALSPKAIWDAGLSIREISAQNASVIIELRPFKIHIFFPIEKINKIAKKQSSGISIHH